MNHNQMDFLILILNVKFYFASDERRFFMIVEKRVIENHE